MRYRFLILILFQFIAEFTFAQSNFKEGYVITIDNKKIYGQIEERVKTSNFQSCIFKTDTGSREYFPDDINGFGFSDDIYYSSEYIENSFVEVLLKGDLTLFKSSKGFHLKKKDEVYDLISSKELVVIDGKEGIRENNKWRGIVSYLVSDCLNSSDVNLANLQLKEKSLIKLVVTYNECKGVDLKEYKKDIKWMKFDLGMSIGFINNNIPMRSETNYLADFYNSKDPSIGFVVDISSPRLNDRISLQSEMHFTYSNYTSLIKKESVHTDVHEVYIELNTLSLPVSFKYSVPLNSFGLIFQGGINIDKHLSNESKLFTERIKGNDVFIYPEEKAFIINDSQFGYWGGLGISKSFKKFKASLSARFVKMTALQNIENYKSNNSRLALNLILYKK